MVGQKGYWLLVIRLMSFYEQRTTNNEQRTTLVVKRSTQ